MDHGLLKWSGSVDKNPSEHSAVPSPDPPAVESIRADLAGSVCKPGQLCVSTSGRMKVTLAFVKTAKSPHKEKTLSLFVFVFVF